MEQPSDDNEIDCPRCGGEMEEFDEDRTLEMDGESLDKAGNVWLEWNCDDCGTGAFHVCVDCNVLVVKCNGCEETMQFIGHMGYNINGKQYQRDAKTGKRVELGGNASPPKDKSKPRFDISDLSKMYFDMTEWYASGQQGDMPHFWYCPGCEERYKFSRMQ